MIPRATTPISIVIRAGRGRVALVVDGDDIRVVDTGGGAERMHVFVATSRRSVHVVPAPGTSDFKISLEHGPRQETA